MKYIVEISLKDSTKIQSIVNASNMQSALGKSKHFYKLLNANNIIRGSKFQVEDNSFSVIEKWNTQNQCRITTTGYNKPFTVIAVDNFGRNTTVNYDTPGYKTAYNIFIQQISRQTGTSADINVFIYDKSQTPVKKSCTAEAKKILQGKNIREAKETLSKAYQKFMQIQTNGGEESNFIQDIPVLCNMIYDYYKGNYTKIPVRVIVGVTAAVIYFVSPADMIPDFIPVVGQLDDITVICWALKCCQADLMEYKQWKMGYTNKPSVSANKQRVTA